MKKIKRSLDKMLYTLVAVVLLFTVIFIMISHTYTMSENEAFEKLHLETLQIKKNINLQMLSDRENLTTMANFASRLHAEGKDYSLLFESFEEIGLFEKIKILLPDNTLISADERIDVSSKISFDEEVKKGEFISGRVKDLNDDSREVVRSAVPVYDDAGNVVAVLYGIIDLDILEAKYAEDAAAMDADLLVMEGENGDFIIDTKRDNLGNVSILASTSYRDGFSYDEMLHNLTNSKPGYCAFMSQKSNEYLYVHYAPLEFADWQIMLLKPSKIVFAGARSTSNYLIIIAALIILIMVAYIFAIFWFDKKKLKISSTASNIRKNLLDINQQSGKITDALKMVADFSKARSAFVFDTYGSDFRFINSEFKNLEIVGDDKNYFFTQLMNYAAKKRRRRGADVIIVRIEANSEFNKELPEFYEFMLQKGIRKICFAIVSGSSSVTSILGAVNPSKNEIMELLRDIAICFSMAINNKKYLNRTETMAFTDALTNVKNRMAFNRDIKEKYSGSVENLSCIFIDVNELHYFNGQYGHSAGDQMLAFIAETLVEEFFGSDVYRMGGDEFLVLCSDMAPDDIKFKMDSANKKIEEMKYHISAGICHGNADMTIDEIVSLAEKAMYAEKSVYYKNKEVQKITKLTNRKTEVNFTGIKEIDAFISVLSVQCLGIYCVNHKTDNANQILSPTYFSSLLEKGKTFSSAMRRYIRDIVKPEYHRALFSLLDYDVLENQLANDILPKITYTKIDGERVSLSVYANVNRDSDEIDTVWYFKKEE